MSHSILITDDSATVRQQLRGFLEEKGFAVVEADNGARGLEIAQDSALDLIIVDVNMPVMNGIEMIKKVRELEAHKKTPIFVLTTDAAGSAARKGKEAGANAWIVKPFKPDVLLKGIQKVVASA